MDSDRTLAQKIILWALLAMTVVFTVVNIVLKFFPGVEFEDTLLKVSRSGDTAFYTGKQHGESISITVTPEDTGSRVDLIIGNKIDHTYRVKYPGGTIRTDFGTYERLTITCNDRVIFDGGYNPDISPLVTFCDLNGENDLLSFGVTYYSDNPWYNYEMTRGQVMAFANGPETTTRGNWGIYIVALICSIICAVAVAFPYTLFELRYHWSVRNPEPTDFYLSMNSLGGGIAAFAILIAYIVGVTKIV